MERNQRPITAQVLIRLAHAYSLDPREFANDDNERTVSELEEIFGRDSAKWNWGEMHASTFRNGTLGESGVSPIEGLFNRGPFPTSGGDSIVNATGWSVRDGYETNWLPSMRMIVTSNVPPPRS